MNAFFVTGTDTEVGKTFVSGTLLQQIALHGKSCVGFKPIASGCDITPEGLRNSDALTLQAASDPEISYDTVNPFAFEEPIAPHIAAKRVGTALTIDAISDAYSNVLMQARDVVIVEGAGGWRLPLGQNQFMPEFVIRHQLPVVIVVGMKLGCLNHAKLTEEAIMQDGLQVAGWIANHIQPNMPFLKENIETLHDIMSSPCLGEVPWSEGGKADASALNVGAFL